MAVDHATTAEALREVNEIRAAVNLHPLLNLRAGDHRRCPIYASLEEVVVAVDTDEIMFRDLEDARRVALGLGVGWQSVIDGIPGHSAILTPPFIGRFVRDHADNGHGSGSEFS